MTDGFGRNDAAPRPHRPSAAAFLFVTLLLVGILIAATIGIQTERDHARAARRGEATGWSQRLMLAEAMGTIGHLDTAEREARRHRGDASMTRYRRTRITVDRALAAVAQGESPGSAERSGIERMLALVARRFATTDAVGRPGGPVRAEIQSQHASLAEVALSRAIQDAGDAIATLVARRQAVETAREQAAYRLIGLIFQLIAPTTIVATMIGIWLWWRASVRHYRLELSAFDTLARLRAVFAGTSDAIVILAPDGRIEDINAAAERLLGYPPAALERQRVSKIIDIGADALSERPRAPQEGPLRLDRIARHRDGSAIPVEVALDTLPFPDGARVVASLRDVSERKAAERMKDDFISTISHELRTPLTSVVGALGLLREGAAGVLPDAAARLTGIAENNARRLIRLVNDILDIDRLGSGQIRLDIGRIDLRDVAARARGDAEGLAAPRGVRIMLDGADRPIPVSGDAERLLQVIGNLLANAIRFSPRGGLVTLGVEVRGGDALLRVEDQGPGVPAEFHSRLFGRFTQSSAGAAIPGGTGLGLAIAREIVRAHDGDIWYADARGGGARFCVSLPLAAGVVADGRRSLLLCEDDAAIAALLRERIEEEGYLVDRCGSAAEARTMARTGRYDVLLLDLSLPDASGLEAIRAIRDQAETRTLPVVVISGSASHRRGDADALGLGVADWIDKPINHPRLMRALAAAIASADGDRPVLLHVEDDADVRAVVALALADRGRILQAGSLASARAVLATCTPAAVILDLDLPDGSGLDLLPALTGVDGAHIPTVVYSAAADSAAVGDGIDAVLIKSMRSPLILSETVAAILRRSPAVAEPAR